VKKPVGVTTNMKTAVVSFDLRLGFSFRTATILTITDLTLSGTLTVPVTYKPQPFHAPILWQQFDLGESQAVGLQANVLTLLPPASSNPFKFLAYVGS
jgi:hypothetical protein